MATLNPYDKEILLSDAGDKALYLLAIKPRKGEQVYNLSLEKFENFVTQIKRKMDEFSLNCDHHFSASKVEASGTTWHTMTSFYGQFTLTELKI